MERPPKQLICGVEILALLSFEWGRVVLWDVVKVNILFVQKDTIYEENCLSRHFLSLVSYATRILGPLNLYTRKIRNTFLFLFLSHLVKIQRKENSFGKSKPTKSQRKEINKFQECLLLTPFLCLLSFISKPRVANNEKEGTS